MPKKTKKIPEPTFDDFMLAEFEKLMASDEPVKRPTRFCGYEFVMENIINKDKKRLG